MRKKRILSLLMTLVLMTSLLPHAAAVSAKNFTDVSEDSWYYEYVDFVAEKGYFAGTSATTFSPDVTMTRAMFVTVLARLDDADVDNSISSFVDVPTDTWYTGSVTWASENGIVYGVGDNHFNPEQAITRQEMCVIMDRFINYYGEKTDQVHKTEGSTAPFPDNNQISSWARTAVANCRKHSLIAGYDDGLFHPLNDSTRAQVATVISRLAWLVKPNEKPGGGGGGGGGGGTTRYTYTLTYDANGGAFSDGQTTRQQTATSTNSSSYTFTVDNINPTREDHSFLGWDTSSSAATANYTAGSSYTVESTRSGTLYAVWIANDDYIGRAVQAAMKQFNEMIPTSSISASAALYPVVFSLATSNNNTRPQTVNARAKVSDDLVATIIDQAATMACSLMDAPPSQDKVSSVVNGIIDALEDAFEITIFGQTAQDIANQVYEKVLAVGKSLWANFYDDDGNYCCGDVTVSINGVTATVKVDQTNHATTLEGDNRTVAVNLGTALAKDMYKDLKRYSEYTGVVELSGTVTFTFEDSNGIYGTETEKYPHVYPVTLNLTLDGGGLIDDLIDDLIEYKYVDGEDSPSYVKLNLTQAIQDAYSKAVNDVVETALNQPSVQYELSTAIENVMNGIGSNSTFQSLISAMEGIGIDRTYAESAVSDAMTAWKNANLDVTDLTASPLYQIYWLDQDVSYKHEAIYKLIDYIAEKAADYAWTTVEKNIGSWALRGLFARVTQDNLRDTLSTLEIDLGLGDYEALEKYVLSKMCDLLRKRAGGDVEDFAAGAAHDMREEVNDLLTDTLEGSSSFRNYLDKAIKLRSIKTMQDVTLSNLSNLLRNRTFQTIVGERGSSYVNRLTNLIGRLPAGASVTIGGESGFTLNKAALNSLKASTTSAACQAIADLIDGSEYLKNLSLSDFCGDDGQEITVRYNSRTFTFHLVVEVK